MAGIGPLIQLVAVGEQNVYLDLLPQVTPWVRVWKRHTPFAMVTQELLFPTGLDFGQKSVVEIPKSGDMLGEVYLELTLPALGFAGTWVDTVGYALLETVKLFFGDTLVHDQDRCWYDLYDRVYLSEGKRGATSQMVGRGVNLSTAVPQLLYVPLHFFFTRVDGPARLRLPLTAMTNTLIRLELTLASLSDLVVGSPAFAAPPSLVEPKLLLNYAFVDDQETQALLATATDLLIEQSVSELTYNYLVENTLTQAIQPTVTV